MAGRPLSWAAAGLVALVGPATLPGVAAGGPGGQLVPGMKPAPPRHVAFGRNCPPNGNRRTPPIRPPDQDVDGDGRPDYFMGSWTFVEPHGDGLVITLWCLKRRPATRLVRGRRRFLHYNDQFALQIATRANQSGPLITQVAPTHPICPFVEGVNLGIGFRSHVCLGLAQPPFDHIPPLITWISVNQHVAGDDRPRQGAVEHLYWPQPGGGVAQGRVVKLRDGSHRFVGSFATAGGLKPAARLTGTDRRQLIADMAVNIGRALREDRGCDSPSFGLPGPVAPPASPRPQPKPPSRAR
jgi:hypothetical protein